jgi:hypothetical protein
MRNAVSRLVLFSFMQAAIAVPAWASATQPSAGFQVNLVVQTGSGEPVGYLKAGDFHVTQADKQYDVTLEQPVIGLHPPKYPTIATRMLVVFDPRLAADTSAVANTVQGLGPVWQRGWQVSVVRPDGLITPYATSQTALQQALNGPPVNSKFVPQTVARNAMKQLRNFPGRRVLLYVSVLTGWENTKVPVALKYQAGKAMVQVYVVDGGEPAHTDTFDDVDYMRRGLNGEPGIASIPSQNLFKFGLFHEVNLYDAISNSVRGAKGYYALELNCSSGSCPDAHVPLSIQIEKDGPLRVTAEAVGSTQTVQVSVSTK